MAPFGTAPFTSSVGDMVIQFLTDNVLPLRNAANHFVRHGVVPSCSNLSNRIWWFILSEAMEKSKNMIRIDVLGFSKALYHVSNILTSILVVATPGLFPNWRSPILCSADSFPSALLFFLVLRLAKIIVRWISSLIGCFEVETSLGFESHLHFATLAEHTHRGVKRWTTMLWT